MKPERFLSLQVNSTNILKLQKVHKDIVKVIHMNQAVLIQVFWRDMITLYDEKV